MNDEPMLKWFATDHLPDDLRKIAGAFGTMARALVESLPRTPERTVSLRKLLESKDAAVRCAVEARK